MTTSSGEPPAGALERLRALCLALPGVVEATSFGHPTWKVRQKAFAVFECYRGDWSVALRADPGEQRALLESDPRFYRTPYLGQHGWVSFKLRGRIPWARLRGLLHEASRLR